MGDCFFENGVGFKPLVVSQAVARTLAASDLVLNLNYDTVFEIAMEQMGAGFVYSPNKPTPGQILVCKSHGSLNMVVREDGRGFTFGQPQWLGMPEPPGYMSFAGILPPRLNKAYDQHLFAQMIMSPLRDRHPQVLTFWGIGLTESDVDLLELYRGWSRGAVRVEVINPNPEVADRMRSSLGCDVKYYSSVEDWRSGTETLKN